MSIINPNSSGQGYSLEHLTNNPLHEILDEHDWKYSHSTPITGLDGKKYLHHTYLCEINKEWAAGVSVKSADDVTFQVGRLGSGRKTTLPLNKVLPYLERKNRELIRKLS